MSTSSRPGVNITAGWIGCNTATQTISGTSMSSPHVAGVALQYLEANPTATPAQVASAITTNATMGKITSPGQRQPEPAALHGLHRRWRRRQPGPGRELHRELHEQPSCTLTSTSTDDVGVVAFEWKRPSGGVIGTTQVLIRTFASAGAKAIILTVTDGGGLTGTITKTINVP